MLNNRRTVYRVRRWGAATGLVGGAIATAIIGMATVHADTTDVLDATATPGSSEDWLSNELSDLDNLAHADSKAFVDDFLTSATTTPIDGATGPADLLATASTNLTDANNVLSGVPSGSEFAGVAAGHVASQDGWLKFIDPLQSAENTISSHDGSLSGLVDQLFFDPIGQNWVQASEAVLNADQVLDTAITSGSGVEAAELGADWADLQMGTAELDSIPVTFAADFF